MLRPESIPLASAGFPATFANMKRVIFADRVLLMGDAAADSLLEYARVLTHAHGVDAVTLRCLGADGDTVEASFLLNGHTSLLVESTNSNIQPPDNAEAVAEIRDRIHALLRPVSAGEEISPWSSGSDEPDDL